MSCSSAWPRRGRPGDDRGEGGGPDAPATRRRARPARTCTRPRRFSIAPATGPRCRPGSTWSCRRAASAWCGRAAGWRCATASTRWPSHRQRLPGRSAGGAGEPRARAPSASSWATASRSCWCSAWSAWSSWPTTATATTRARAASVDRVSSRHGSGPRARVGQSRMSLRSAAIGPAALVRWLRDGRQATRGGPAARAEGARGGAGRGRGRSGPWTPSQPRAGRAEGSGAAGPRCRARRRASLAAVEAEWAARLALSEARCAAREQAQAQQPTVEDVRRLETRAKKGEDEQRRLEEQLAPATARAGGHRDRARSGPRGASRAWRRGRGLLRHRGGGDPHGKRLDTRGRAGTTRKDAEGELAKAKKLLDEENYGAALFFAMKAQNMVTKRGRLPPRCGHPTPSKPAPQGTYVVQRQQRATSASRSSTDAPVVGTARQGDPLKALAVRGACG